MDVTSDHALPATSYVVLGLVSVRPAAGHELAGLSERSVGNFFPIARSQIYSELDRLCRLGFLSVTEVEQQRWPTKRVYELTEAGETELRRWLEEAPVEAERTRNLFLVRVFFADRVSPERLVVLLDEYAETARAQLEVLTALAGRLADHPEAVFRRATAVYGMRHAQATLDWIADVRAILSESVSGVE